jgi:uncharacterized membrane protein YidH (DUF202 family)
VRLIRRLVEQPTDVADPGGQGERTYLSWQRTALSFAALGGALVHYGAEDHRPTYGVLGIFGLAVAAVLLGAAMPRYRFTVSAARGVRRAALAPLILLTTITATLLSVGALLLITGV